MTFLDMLGEARRVIVGEEIPYEKAVQLPRGAQVVYRDSRFTTPKIGIIEGAICGGGVSIDLGNHYYGQQYPGSRINLRLPNLIERFRRR